MQSNQLLRDEYSFEVTEMVNVLPCQLVFYNKFQPYLKDTNPRIYLNNSDVRSNLSGLTKGREKNKSAGDISNKAASRIRKAVRLQILTAKKKRVYSKLENKWFTFYVNFVTLTLSSKQIHSDDEIKKYCLQPFIRIIQSKYGIHKYIWKAEAQSNGNIHFHITLDKFIHWRSVRKHWNKCQDKLSYVSRSGLADPNSTDIHSVVNISKLENYLIKYLSKNDDTKRKIEGKTWDCSANLKNESLSVPYEKFYKEFDDLTGTQIIDLRENYFEVVKVNQTRFKEHARLYQLWKQFSDKLVDDIQINFTVDSFKSDKMEVNEFTTKKIDLPF